MRQEALDNYITRTRQPTLADTATLVQNEESGIGMVGQRKSLSNIAWQHCQIRFKLPFGNY